MSEISYPFPVLEFGSTHIRLAIFDKKIINQSLFYEEKIDFTRNINFELDKIESAVAGPKRPQDLIKLSKITDNFKNNYNQQLLQNLFK